MNVTRSWAASFGVGVSLGDPFWVVIDADSAGTKPLGCGDHDTAVTAPEIVNDVVAGDTGQLKHSMDHGVGRRDVGRQAGSILPSGRPDGAERHQRRHDHQQRCYSGYKDTHLKFRKPVCER